MSHVNHPPTLGSFRIRNPQDGAWGFHGNGQRGGGGGTSQRRNVGEKLKEAREDRTQMRIQMRESLSLNK